MTIEVSKIPLQALLAWINAADDPCEILKIILHDYHAEQTAKEKQL